VRPSRLLDVSLTTLHGKQMRHAKLSMARCSDVRLQRRCGLAAASRLMLSNLLSYRLILTHSLFFRPVTLRGEEGEERADPLGGNQEGGSKNGSDNDKNLGDNGASGISRLLGTAKLQSAPGADNQRHTAASGCESLR